MLFLSFRGLIEHILAGKVNWEDLRRALFYFCTVPDEDTAEVFAASPEQQEQVLKQVRRALLLAEKEKRYKRRRRGTHRSYFQLNNLLAANGCQGVVPVPGKRFSTRDAADLIIRANPELIPVLRLNE